MTILEKRALGETFTMLTCYDYPTARAYDDSDIDSYLIGDSVGTNVLGYRSVHEVTLSDIIHHLKAVRRGVNSRKVIVADLPYQTYRSGEEAIANARELTGRGADVIKVEGGAEIAPVLQAMVADGLVVMGHVGFQPQILQGGKHSVVGALHEDAKRVFDDAAALQEAGACGVVVECVPEMVCKEITERLHIPTIGIGSGKY